MALDLDDELYRVNLNYLKKERYTGSSDGLRFLLERQPAEEEGGEDLLHLAFWPEPYRYEATEDALKRSSYFPFTEGGLAAALDALKGEI